MYMQSDAEQIQYLVGVLRFDKFIVYTLTAHACIIGILESVEEAIELNLVYVGDV